MHYDQKETMEWIEQQREEAMALEYQSEETPFQTDINRAIKMLQYLYVLEPQIQRIQELVQNNEDFFDAKWGDNLLRAAADKLEELAEAYSMLKISR
jgi:hypothetical protein